MYKKGSIVFRDVSDDVAVVIWLEQADKCAKYELVEPGTHNTTVETDSLAEPIQQSKTQAESDKKRRAKARIVVQHIDIIKPEFWDRRPWLLSNKPGKIPKEP
jgi:tRNA(His) guanylyltransferase